MRHIAHTTHRNIHWKRWVPTLLLLICPLLLKAQPQITLNSSTNGTFHAVHPTSGLLLNSKTVNGHYEAGTDYSITLSSTCNYPLHISVLFNSFDVAPYDSLIVYDGTTTSDPVLICCNNALNPPGRTVIYASPSPTTSHLTVRFVTHSNNGTGWQLYALCRIPCEISTTVIDDTFYRVRNGQIIDTCLLETHNITDTIHNEGHPDTYRTSSYRIAHVCQGDYVRLRGHGEYAHYDNAYNPTDATSTFCWNFGNGDTLSRLNGTQVTTKYSAINCYTVTLGLIDTIGCASRSNDVIRVRIAPNPIRNIPPLPNICNSDTARYSTGRSTASQVTLNFSYNSICTYQVSIDTILLRYDSIASGRSNPGVVIIPTDSSRFLLSTQGIYGNFPIRATMIDNFGCVWDSTLTIASFPDTYDTLDISSCISYPWHNTTYSQSGQYRYRGTSSHGCDSIEILNLTIHDSVVNILPAESHCYSHTWNGLTASIPGAYRLRHVETGSAGCDSIVYLPVSIKDSSVRTLPAETHCYSYTWNGHTRNSSGTYRLRDSRTAANGCDSITYLPLTISDSILVTLPPQWYCDHYTWNGMSRTVPGTYHLRYASTSTDNCDSITHLTLTIRDRSDSSVVTLPPQSQCYDYIWDGISYTTPGTYHLRHQTISTHNCDSITYLTLTIHDSSVVHVPSFDACYSYTWNGIAVSGTGAHDLRYSTADMHHCDSIVYTTITIKDSSSAHTYDTIIENQLPWQFNGASISHATNDTVFAYTNAVGCDSLLHYHLFVYRNISQNYDSTVCDDQLPVTWMGRLYTQAGSSSMTFTGSHGEDSTVTQTLIVHPSSSSMVCDTIVENRLPWNFNGHIYNGNVYGDSVVINNVWQCDSIITYSLHIYHNLTARYDDDICDDQLPYTWMGHVFTSADSISNTYTAQHGEDSTIVLVLNVRNVTSGYASDTIVQNQLPWYYNGIGFADSAEYVFHKTNAAGCDSIIHYTLFVYRNVLNSSQKHICDNEFPYTWNGIVFTETGTQSATLHTAHGADSIVLMTLLAKPTYHDSIFAETCNGTPYEFNGNYYGSPGIFPASFTAANDCDSVVELHLTVHPSYINNVNPIICDDSCYTHDGHTYTQSGTYQLTYNTIHGCDSTINIRLRVRPTYDNYVELVICHGTYVEHGDSIFTTGGTHTFAMTSMDGCDSVEHLYLHEDPLPVPNISLEPEYATYDRLNIRLRDNSRDVLSREWYIDREFAGTEEVVYYLFPSERDTIPVRLIVTGPMGCVDSADVMIPFRKHTIWTPNIFTPKRIDNNRFCVTSDDMNTAEVSIYTRTGALVCTFDAMNDCWDGTKNGVTCPQGSYVYTVRFTSKSDPKNPQVKTGTVTLIY